MGIRKKGKWRRFAQIGFGVAGIFPMKGSRREAKGYALNVSKGVCALRPNLSRDAHILPEFS